MSTSQFQFKRIKASPAYWRLTFDNPPRWSYSIAPIPISSSRTSILLARPIRRRRPDRLLALDRFHRTLGARSRDQHFRSPRPRPRRRQ